MRSENVVAWEVMVCGVSSSSLRDALIRRTIAGKSVVSFPSHHYALLPWQEWRQELNQPLRLLSIDFHTDTHPAFQHYAYYARNPNAMTRGVFVEQDQAARLAKLSATDVASVEAAVQDLRHDEHIDAAIQCGILDIAFIMAHESKDKIDSSEVARWKERNMHILSHLRESRPQPPFTYVIPQNRIILLGDDAPRPDDQAYRQSRDRILEADVLRARLQNASEICRSAEVNALESRPFILDIDLDSFNTRRAIEPQDPSEFYDLIRDAYAITIAQEPTCVDMCQVEGEELTAAWLEENILYHIKQALS